MAAPDVADDPDLARVEWKLDPLLARNGDGPASVDALLDEALRRADAFAAAYAGRVAELDGPGLVACMTELADLQDVLGRAGSYAALNFSTATADPERGALLQKVQERGTQIETRLLFFELEWAALDDEQAERLLATEALDFARHHLRTARRYRPHLLSEPEEKILAEKSLTSHSAWTRLFEEQAAAIEVDLSREGEDAEGGPVALEVALARLFSPDREVRRFAAERVTAALEPGLRVRAYVLNTLMADKMVDDRLRRYPHWLSSRNLANEASDESVAALIEAVRARYELPRRWYRLKAQLLGLDRLADYDRMAAVTSEDDSIPWSEARDLVLDSYASFSPALADTAREFFDGAYIDAPVRPGKRGGAFCAYTVPSAHPYVLLNYTARRRDVLTLAHELGHGVHASLARPQGVFHFATPLTMAETASVFGETIVFGRLLARAPTPESRLSLLAESIEGSIATVFRQVAMNRFEDLAHTTRRSEGELALDRINALWGQSQEELLGDAVEITAGYRSWWSYVPHFINTPGYVYAYAYGQLLALAVYARYEEQGEAFVPAYLDLLSAGGSRPPEELGRIVGVDLTDPGFWDTGLNLVQRQLDAAENAAREAGRLD
jgi:oligoendopeptidase F